MTMPEFIALPIVGGSSRYLGCSRRCAVGSRSRRRHLVEVFARAASRSAIQILGILDADEETHASHR